jgi:hypothetical protein
LVIVCVQCGISPCPRIGMFSAFTRSRRLDHDRVRPYTVRRGNNLTKLLVCVCMSAHAIKSVVCSCIRGRIPPAGIILGGQHK